MKPLPQAFFDNRIEQAKIRQDVLSAIPEDVYYHNLIIAFAELLARFTESAFQEEVYSKSHSKSARENT